jgi:hypothetical protein
MQRAMPRRKASTESSAKIEVNEASLVRLGAKRLAALLFEASDADPVLARRLRMELLASDPIALGKEIDRQIQALRRARAFVDWRKIGDLAKTLDGLRASIASGLGERDPAAAAERLFAFLTLAQPSLERADDSNGRIGDVFRDACADLGAVVALIPDATAQLGVARRAFAAADQDGYGVLDNLVAHVAARLPAEPLSAFRELAEAELADAAADPQGEGSFPRRRWFCARALAAIADAQGDVDLFIAAEMAKGPRVRDDAGMAERLVRVGRPAEALALLDAAEPNPAKNTNRLEDIRIAALDALGRKGEAQEVRWAAFKRALRLQPLRDLLKRIDDFDADAKEDEALQFVSAHRDVVAALVFLIEWSNLRKAGELVRARRAELNGDYYWAFGPAAERLEDKEPLAATLLYRAMIDFALNAGRSTRYGHAARHLVDCERLGARIEDWGGAPDHGAYVGGLRAKHPRKSGFWSRMEPGPD